MALVLAIEPNAAQADALRHLLHSRPDTDVVVVGSTDAAVAAINARLPDLVLVGALLSPRDEGPFIAHLRTLPDAGHLQTLTIPQLRRAARLPRRGLAIFGRRTRRQKDKAACGCDPTQFRDEVGAYLARACEVKAEIEQRKAAAVDGDPPVADRTEPVRCRSSISAEEPSRQVVARVTDPGPGLETAPDEGEGERYRVATLLARTSGQADTDTTHAAELVRVRADAERTLATELTAAEERHRADIARLKSEAAESRVAAARDATARAEAQADETLAAQRNGARAEAELMTLAARLATADERHRADITRLETEAREKSEATTRDARAPGDRAPLRAAAPSTSISLRRSIEPVHRAEDGVDGSAATDYYDLWRARFAAADAPRVEAGLARRRPPRVDPRRRRWALSVAATLLILLTNNAASGSAPNQGLTTVAAASVSHAIGPTRSLDRDDTMRTPNPGGLDLYDPGEPATADNPETDVSSRTPLSQLVIEIMCVLVVMLLLCVTLFVGKGLVWHGLVVTLGLILLGFVVMRAPWGG